MQQKTQKRKEPSLHRHTPSTLQRLLTPLRGQHRFLFSQQPFHQLFCFFSCRFHHTAKLSCIRIHTLNLLSLEANLFFFCQRAVLHDAKAPDTLLLHRKFIITAPTIILTGADSAHRRAVAVRTTNHLLTLPSSLE